MTVRCWDCTHFRAHWFSDLADPDGINGSCTFPVVLPYAWRYAPREVMSADSHEDIECDTFAARGDAPVRQEDHPADRRKRAEPGC